MQATAIGLLPAPPRFVDLGDGHELGGAGLDAGFARPDGLLVQGLAHQPARVRVRHHGLCRPGEQGRVRSKGGKRFPAGPTLLRPKM